MIVNITEEELRKSVTARHALETTKKGIKCLDILIFILIKRTLIMVNKICGIENHVLFVASIIMLLPSVGRE